MASVTVSDASLGVTLRLWDKILAVHGSLHIPLEHVVSAAAEQAPPIQWFRKLIGTDFPGVIAAGTFFTKGGLAFYDYHAGRECLVLRLHHERYVQVVVEIDPPQTAAEVADAVTAALRQRSS